MDCLRGERKKDKNKTDNIFAHEDFILVTRNRSKAGKQTQEIISDRDKFSLRRVHLI